MRMTIELAVALLVLVIFGLLAWRLFSLRRAIGEFEKSLRQLPTKPPADVKQLENLSSAVRVFAEELNRRLSTLTGERDRLAAVLDQMTDGVLIADANGEVRFSNPAARRLFESPDPVGRSVTEVVRNHQLVDAWRRSRQTGELQSESVEIPTRRLFLQLIVMPDRHGGGSLFHVQDLTRVRRLETVRRDFVSNISHELRTPLASLKALTETLQSGALSDPDAAPRFMERIVTEVDALTQMTQELLDLSRIESGQVALDFQAVSPRTVLESSAGRMKMQADRAGLDLRVECADETSRVRADPVRLEQVLVNLIHNAIKFTKSGGEVVLSAEAIGQGEAAGDVVRFAVRDTGAGIPAEDIPRIFERFYRVDKARTGGGTGLGLSISRHIVEAHGGRIWAESIEGRGSTFFFTIPRLP